IHYSTQYRDERTVFLVVKESLKPETAFLQ
ncbi:MAG: hypothetical protein RL713_1262, partial [Bacteroidota bacterium]